MYNSSEAIIMPITITLMVMVNKTIVVYMLDTLMYTLSADDASIFYANDDK